VCNFEKLTRIELAKLFGVNPSTISRHKQAGMPLNDDGKTFNGPVCIQWLISRVESAVSKDSGETDASRHWLTEFRKERAKTARIERKKAESELIPKRKIAELWNWRAGMFRNGLLQFSFRLPPLLENKNQLEMRDVLHDESCRLLSGMIKDHEYCPLSEIPKEYLNLDKLTAKPIAHWFSALLARQASAGRVTARPVKIGRGTARELATSIN